jgi:hypothetical protein
MRFCPAPAYSFRLCYPRHSSAKTPMLADTLSGLAFVMICMIVVFVLILIGFGG